MSKANSTSESALPAGDAGRGMEPNPTVGKAKRDKSRDVIATLEARLAKIELFMCDGNDKFEELGQSIEELQSGGDELRWDMLGALNTFAATIRGELEEFKESLLAELASIREEVKEVKSDWSLCKMVVTQGAITSQTTLRVDVPRPKTFNGSRNAREIDNFLWGLEQYFDASGVVEDGMKIKTAALYFTDAAMLWWRRRCNDIERGTLNLESWDDLKREIKRQFYPMNAVAEARAKLRHLTHRGTIREYVKEFSELLLEVPTMSDEEALFDFIDGLQNWAKLEFQRRTPQDLASAIAIAESLIDFGKRESPRFGGKWDKHESSEEDEVEKDEKDDEIRPRSPTYQRKTDNKERDNGGRLTHREKYYKGEKGNDKPPLSCFLCKGPHKAMYWPQREKLSSLLQREEAMEEAVQEETTMGSLRLLDSIKGKVGVPKPERKGRMYLSAKVNGVDTKALLDTGASHNFLEIGEAKRLGITYIKEQGWLKTVNSAIKPIYGVARGVRLHLGEWCGLVDFSVVDMDDFKMVLGVE